VLLLPTYNEGLPLALIEAMCYGIPVITTPVSGIPDIVTDRKNGLLVPPGDIEALSHAMAVSILDESFRLSMGKAARETAESLDIHVFWQRLLHIYTMAMNPSSNHCVLAQHFSAHHLSENNSLD
jgi:glycosyltransferase involved in cell wall biosynthesis